MDNTRLRLFIQFIRFNIVGVTNVALTYLIYSVLVFVGVHFRLALVLEYMVGIVFTFFANRAFTFRHAGSRGWGAFGRIVLTYAVVLGINVVALSYLIENLGWNEYLAQFILMIVLAGLSFFTQKTFVFREQRHEH